eukprot:753552-Hanusia_phi.AAC.2
MGRESGSWKEGVAEEEEEDEEEEESGREKGREKLQTSTRRWSSGVVLLICTRSDQSKRMENGSADSR